MDGQPQWNGNGGNRGGRGGGGGGGRGGGKGGKGHHGHGRGGGHKHHGHVATPPQWREQPPQQQARPAGAPAQQPVPVGGQAPVRANPMSRTTSTTRAEMTSELFQDLPVSVNLKKAMAEVLRYESMTKVQAMTIATSLGGGDVLAKAKTGTGKTLAFLIPTAHLIEQNLRPGATSALIISPTRELASQIAEEAGQLLTFTRIRYQVVFGGVPIKGDLSRFRQNGFPDLLVGTPGRMNDHLENHGLARALQGSLRCMVFDEADQLLEMGFRPDITKMLRMLPPNHTRQTLLFSATMPNDVLTIAKFALRQQYAHIDCVGEEQDTHQHVPQSFCVHPPETQFAELHRAIQDGINEDPDYKMLVFFTTARLTQLAAELFNSHAVGMRVLEIHSRKSQPQRTAASNQFRDNSRVIMFTSDVTARGMDYPDVSKVIQVGLPSDKAQYTHRLGRTARAGKSGNGVLLLCDFEKGFLRQLHDQGLTEVRPLSPDQAGHHQPQISRGLQSMSKATLCAAYQAWLGFYNSNLKAIGWSKPTLVEHANYWVTECCLLREVPSLQAKTVGKMGLRDVPGLRVEGKAGVPRRDVPSGGGKGGGKGGKGGGGGGHQFGGGRGGGAKGGAGAANSGGGGGGWYGH
eukprot:Rhum_TRINITY_DN15106_c24_g1::Rhum_TRINITY_DN15106_c24_g1_i1::g.139875::m.139875/K17679/MSS116; ATP-dependent RNA helicase MSS116, mitochondrial